MIFLNYTIGFENSVAIGYFSSIHKIVKQEVGVTGYIRERNVLDKNTGSSLGALFCPGIYIEKRSINLSIQYYIMGSGNAWGGVGFTTIGGFRLLVGTSI